MLHAPDRPTWRCDTCRYPWPCPVMRAQLRDDYQGNRMALGAYIGGYLALAIGDLTAPAPQIYQQVVGWIRLRPATVDAAARQL